MLWSTAQRRRRRLPYFELLLCDGAVLRVEKLEDVGDQISAAEIVGSQCRVQHALSSAADLEGHNKTQLSKHSIPAHVLLSLCKSLKALQFRLEYQVQYVKNKGVLLNTGHMPSDIQIPQVPWTTPVLHGMNTMSKTQVKQQSHLLFYLTCHHHHQGTDLRIKEQVV
ncbi:hypothetical protein EYF80_023061 [Liparis tanakae]|uniref:Uncharacterized protein n=1 Tax=Liparis tanakae TaxID=230148 RepID=A0A4Z2HPG6_9TELE|nr:hypothetical protein EYF80_023061 [Liparis tanakae]